MLSLKRTYARVIMPPVLSLRERCIFATPPPSLRLLRRTSASLLHADLWSCRGLKNNLVASSKTSHTSQLAHSEMPTVHFHPLIDSASSFSLGLTCIVPYIGPFARNSLETRVSGTAQNKGTGPFAGLSPGLDDDRQTDRLTDKGRYPACPRNDNS